MLKLRPYQEYLAHEVFANWRRGHRGVLMQLPTGGGKTATLSKICREFTSKGMAILVLAHRLELVDQLADKLEEVCEEPTIRVKRKTISKKRKGLIYVGSIQSVLSCYGQLPSIGLVVIDECHRAISHGYRQVMSRFRHESYLLGVTATPVRYDGRGFKEQFDVLVSGYQTRDLIDDGYLSPFRMFVPQERIEAQQLGDDGEEYDPHRLGNLIDTKLITSNPAKIWSTTEDCYDRKTIVFCHSISVAERLLSSYLSLGVETAIVTGSTPKKERAQTLAKFKSGEVQVVLNSDLYVEGLDVPDIGCVQILKPTRSLVTYLQMVGRGLRIANGKKDCIILDHTDNSIVHGMPDEKRRWTLEPTYCRSSSAKTCDECGHRFAPTKQEMETPIDFVFDAGTRYAKHRANCPKCRQDFEFYINKSGGRRVQVKDEELDIYEYDATLDEVGLNVSPIAKHLLSELERIKKEQNHDRKWVFRELEKRSQKLYLDLGDWRYFSEKLFLEPSWAYNNGQNSVRNRSDSKSDRQSLEPSTDDEDEESKKRAA